MLQLRRLRRVCRPLLPIIVRALIVIFTAIELKPATPSLSDTSRITPLLSRIGVMAGTLSALLSVIFFDVRVFNFVTIGAVVLHFAFNIHAMGGPDISVSKLAAFVCFHSTAILFSALVGRRRSISKPSVLRANASYKRFYLHNLKAVRHVDLLEAGTRLQACILALDYSLARSVKSSAFFFTLPFAALFLAGYATQKNGAVLLLLLLSFAVVNESSPLLGFNFTKTVSTVSGAFLGLSVGPGLLTVDEWLATADQLYY